MNVNKVQLANGETIIDISDSTVTPETLAEGVTAHDASGRKITGKMIPGGGSSVQSDWNQTDSSAADFIKNKPFGESLTGGDTLTWNGNIAGLDNVEGVYYKVSDIVPTIEDFVNGGVITVSDGRSMNVVNKDVRQDGTNILIAPGGNMPVAVIATSDANGFSTGLYLMSMEGMYVSSFTINGYNGFETKVVKPIDNKYLEPFETVGGDTLTWDGNTEGLYEIGGMYRIAEITPTLADVTGKTAILLIGENSLNLSVTDMTADTGGVESYALMNAESGLMVQVFTADIPTYSIVKGIYVSEEILFPFSLTINGYTGFTTTKLKEEYIPVDYIKQLIAEVTGN